MAIDMFLKLDGIDGESTDDVHKKEIQLVSCTLLNLANPASVGTGTTGLSAGKVNFQDIACTARSSKASPELFMAVATGKHIAKATIVFRKSGGDEKVEYIKAELEKVFVTHYSVSELADSNGETLDQFALAFAKVKYIYTPQKTDGGGADAPAEMAYDLELNKKV